MTGCVTVAMIVRDEERVLARCLKSVEGTYDELVIVDTGSSDDTPNVAMRHGARLLHYSGANGPNGRIEDFSNARNVALDLATCDWVLQIDADEILLSGHDEIGLIAKGACADAVAVRMRSEGSEWHSIRLFRRQAVRRYVSKIHEYPEISGEMRTDDVLTIAQRSDQNRRLHRERFSRCLGTLSSIQLTTISTDMSALWSRNASATSA